MSLSFLQCKYNSALVDKEESKTLIKRQEVEILDLRETLRLRILSEDIEVTANTDDCFLLYSLYVCMGVCMEVPTQ